MIRRTVIDLIPDPPLEDEGQVRMGTLNLACAAPLYHGHGLGQAIDMINRESLDIFAGQEIDRFAKDSGFRDFPAAIAAGTELRHSFYSAAYVHPPEGPGMPPREYGNVLLSRFPFNKTFSVLLSGGPHVPPPSIAPTWGQDRRVALFAETQTESGPAWFVSTHLSNSVGDGRESAIIRHYQARNLVHYLRLLVPPGRAPVSVMGDLNFAAGSTDLAPLHEALECHTGSIGPTWPLYPGQGSETMNASLDHIFTEGVAVSQITIVADPSMADHAAVLARASLRQPARSLAHATAPS